MTSWRRTSRMSRCTVYDDALVVTEAGPLISYLLSTRVSSSLDNGARTELVRRVQDSLAAGVIRISKDVGLFEAW